MGDSVNEYLPYLIILFVLIVGTVFLWKKALSASKKHYQERDRIMNDMKKMNELKKEYGILTEEKLNGVPDEKLFEAAVANITLKTEEKDMLEAFKKLTNPQKLIYTAWYIDEDSKGRKISDFFRINGEPLLSLASVSFEAFNEMNLARIAAKAYSAFDEDNYDVSSDKENVDEIDSEFENEYKKIDIKKLAAEYIRKNFEYFIDK